MKASESYSSKEILIALLTSLCAVMVCVLGAIYIPAIRNICMVGVYAGVVCFIIFVIASLIFTCFVIFSAAKGIGRRTDMGKPNSACEFDDDQMREDLNTKAVAFSENVYSDAFLRNGRIKTSDPECAS